MRKRSSVPYFGAEMRKRSSVPYFPSPISRKEEAKLRPLFRSPGNEEAKLRPLFPYFPSHFPKRGSEAPSPISVTVPYFGDAYHFGDVPYLGDSLLSAPDREL